MTQKIFLPNDEQTAQLIDGAWQDFCKRAMEAGFGSDVILNFKDFFVAGYCYGSGDMLNTIRDQLNAEYIANETMNKGCRQ